MASQTRVEPLSDAEITAMRAAMIEWQTVKTGCPMATRLLDNL